jgi:hypothetical protein
MSKAVLKIFGMVLMPMLVVLAVFPYGYVRAEVLQQQTLVNNGPLLNIANQASRTSGEFKIVDNGVTCSSESSTADTIGSLHNTALVQGMSYLQAIQGAANLNYASLSCDNAVLSGSKQSSLSLKVSDLVEKYALKKTNSALVRLNDGTKKANSVSSNIESKVSFVPDNKGERVELKVNRIKNWQPKAVIQVNSTNYEILLC